MRALFKIALCAMALSVEISAARAEEVLSVQKNQPQLFEGQLSPAAAVNNRGEFDTHSATRVHAFTLRTNLLYWCGGVINGGVEWRSGEGRVGYLINGGYSPFANQDWDHNMGGYFVAPEVRYYMGERRRGYLGVQGLLAGYNYKMSPTGYQGDMYGGGVVGGYRTRISRRMDIDFTLGAGAAKFDYGEYRIIFNGMSLYEEYGIEEWKYIPMQVSVALIFGRY